MQITNYLIQFAISMISTWWIFKHTLKIAKLKNIVDNPEARKLQRVPVPVLGGVAIFFGMTVSLVFSGLMFNASTLFTIMGVMIIMLYIGTIDDILSLSPYLRFLIEIIVILALIYCNNYSLNDFHGLWGIGNIPQWVAVPLTVFACVGIINAINLIDGVNGLSSGYCFCTCAIFAGMFIWADDMEAASLAMISAGALIPFFCHNVFGEKTKMFIGDGGALLMGTVISTFVIEALNTNSTLAAKVGPEFGMIPFTLAILAIPIFDTLRVMTARIVRGKSPFRPDKTHLHHLFLDLGFSHIGTTVTEIMSNLLIVLVWWLSFRAGMTIDCQLYIVIALGMLVTFGFYKFARIQIQKDSKIYHTLRKTGGRTHISHTRGFKALRDLLDRNCQ